jgi:hypothetical protein
MFYFDMGEFHVVGARDPGAVEGDTVTLRPLPARVREAARASRMRLKKTC